MTAMSNLLALSSLLLSVCLAAGWQNAWDRHHFGSCENGQYMRRLRSIHDNGKEDRLWQVYCGKTSTNVAATQSCLWTGFVNDWDRPLVFQCPGNRLISGMMSYHDNKKEDRRFRFRCCAVPGRSPNNCAWTGYVNDWDRPMDFRVPSDKVIAGAFSVHNNHKEDRRWKFLL